MRVAINNARGDGPAREWVLACVDNSEYANSVSDHAGWFASHPEVGVDVLHVLENSSTGGEVTDPGIAAQGDKIVSRAVSRLREEGVGPIAFETRNGSLFDIASKHDAGPIVMGKRGADSNGGRGRLGSQAHAMVSGSDRPVCLAPKVFLPIHRAFVLLDADLSHRSALEFVAADFRLAALPLDVAVVSKPGQDPDPKVEWARAMLSACSAEIFPLVNTSFDDAVALCMEARGADLMILSRAVAGSDLEAQMLRIEERGLWGTRTPVLIS
jgi:hypothetical protein